MYIETIYVANTVKDNICVQVNLFAILWYGSFRIGSSTGCQKILSKSEFILRGRPQLPIN